MSKQAEKWYREKHNMRNIALSYAQKADVLMLEAYHKTQLRKMMPSDLDAMDEFNRLEQWCLDSETRKPQQKSFLAGYRFVKEKLLKSIEL